LYLAVNFTRLNYESQKYSIDFLLAVFRDAPNCLTFFSRPECPLSEDEVVSGLKEALTLEPEHLPKNYQ